jgi:bifunctional UDP-N-acetylglucosamine pyrophosphorylase/glucosamine-1-phosphate N-acetyltransferase
VTDTAPPSAVVVLAAGEGKRMKSALAKVLHAICGRTLLGHVLAAAEPLAALRTAVVVGHGRDQVIAHLAEVGADVTPVVQEEQRGTGHAVRLALEALQDTDSPDSDQSPKAVADVVVVLPGDAPMLTAPTLQALLRRHRETSAAATVLTAVVPNPSGYGRIVRDPDGHVIAIVEERDADEATRQTGEINTSVYSFDAGRLREALSRLDTDNAQGEEYLTDVIRLLVGDKAVVASVTVVDPLEALGVNDRVQLAAVRRAMRDRIVERWMLEGVTVVDPQTTWMGVNVTLDADCVIHQNTQLHGTTHVARMAEVGPDSMLRNTHVGEGAKIVRSHCTGAEVGPDASVGPYAYLRPGTVLRRDVKVGAYVETKQAVVGEGSKVPHLSYVGDAEIGERSNIGAATIFVNYDGSAKHRTTIGDDVRIGSDTMLVAPVSIGDGAYTAAGSVITDDVPPGAMGVGRAHQRNVEGWVERRRPDSPSAAAARRSREDAPTDPPGDADEPADAEQDGRTPGATAGGRETMQVPSPPDEGQGAQ